MSCIIQPSMHTYQSFYIAKYTKNNKKIRMVMAGRPVAAAGADSHSKPHNLLRIGSNTRQNTRVGGIGMPESLPGRRTHQSSLAGAPLRLLCCRRKLLVGDLVLPHERHSFLLLSHVFLRSLCRSSNRWWLQFGRREEGRNSGDYVHLAASLPVRFCLVASSLSLWSAASCRRSLDILTSPICSLVVGSTEGFDPGRCAPDYGEGKE